MTTTWIKRLVWTLIALLFLPAFVIAALGRGRRTLIVWGSAPLKANRYWSAALREQGLDSMTIMGNLFSINQRSDFDRYFEDFSPAFVPHRLRVPVGACLALLFVLRHAAALHTTYFGFALTLSYLWRLEAPLLRLAGVKTVVIAFGADAYIFSRIVDTSMRYGQLASYPWLARLEPEITRKVDYWNRHAGVVITTLMIDGLGRWDVTMNQAFVIDLAEWRGKEQYGINDGRSGPVRVIHTPNHKGLKGTEFVIDAVERLRREGLDVELLLLEKVPNETVKNVMQTADILAEQFIMTGYAMSGIEGMASGLPVLANLEHEAYTRVFRRFGFLTECPVVSTTPETLVNNLRMLVTKPELRASLGRSGRAYVEKYHSFAMAQYLFGAIHDRLIRGKDVDLISLFHPLTSEYNRRTPVITHPLVESRIPKHWMDLDV